MIGEESLKLVVGIIILIIKFFLVKCIHTTHYNNYKNNILLLSHLLEKCCHDFDLINWILNSKAKKVSSFGGLNFYTKKNE